jgi:hypothetical protein
MAILQWERHHSKSLDIFDFLWLEVVDLLKKIQRVIDIKRELLRFAWFRENGENSRKSSR